MCSTVTKVDSSYISSACNRTPHAADWGYNGLICYGACNGVAVFEPKAGGGGKVKTILTGHTGRVNATKWVKKSCFTPETELVSVSADNCGLVWSQSGDTYSVSDVLKGHSGSVTVVDAVYQPTMGTEATLVIVTASIDSTIRIWERQYLCAAVCRKVVQLDGSVCLSVSVALRHSSLLVACAMDDCHIHLYTEAVGALVKCQVLRGHEDWVSALDFITEDSGDLLLASGSQDATVRLWRFRAASSVSQAQDQLFHVEEKTLTVGSDELAVGLESVLLGHDARVYGIRWHPQVKSGSGTSQPLKLLTASLDKTVVVWAPEEQSGVWLEQARMGEVGGNTLGFYGACYGPGGDSILAHSYQGGFHMWCKHQEGWRPGVVVGGHFDVVADLGWEPQLGRYVLSVSADQTTRLHAPWTSTDENEEYSWHEIARPQVHGYDLVCLAMLPRFRFVSGADEKVVRAFAAPQNFLENFKRLCLKKLEEEEIDDKLTLPAGAAVPVLGLSNKAVFQSEVDRAPEQRHVKDQYDENSYFTPQHLVEPPTEDTLLQNTLWPETMKLYGHGYEVFSLATTTDGKLLASACKATNEEHAAILLWDTSTWQKVGRLVSHQLTVTQMQFSPDDQFLLSVSRDRRWSVFQRTDSEMEKYKLAGRTDKSTGIHTRIIWCCCWSHDSIYFATGSRDGKVVIWEKLSENHPTLGSFGPTSEFLDLPKESITSVAFGPDLVISRDEYFTAVGSEAGDVRLYGWSKSPESSWRFLFQLSGNCGHHLAVRRLCFRPVPGKAGQPRLSTSDQHTDSIIQLASCGLDHAVRVYDVHIHCNKS